MTDPTLPVAAQSQRQVRPIEEAPSRPVDLTLKSDSARALVLRTCPQCGLNPAGAPVARTFQWVPPWVFAGLLLNIIVLLILYYVGRQRLMVQLPLCADCAAADKRGRTIVGFAIASVFALPALFALIGSVVDNPGIGAGIGFVAGLVAAGTAVFRTRPQVIECRKIDKKAGTITLRAAPSWRGVVEREQPEALAG